MSVNSPVRHNCVTNQGGKIKNALISAILDSNKTGPVMVNGNNGNALCKEHVLHSWSVAWPWIIVNTMHR